MMLEGKIQNGMHHLGVRVYYEDTDFSGFVYHANYLKFCERARSDWIRLLGINQNDMINADGLAIVIRKMICDFLRPAKFDDILTVESSLGDSSGVRMMMNQRVLRGLEVLFTAEVTAVLVDKAGKPKRLTPDFLKAMAPPS
jgi:acyl-CoA thioester hydrolase